MNLALSNQTAQAQAPDNGAVRGPAPAFSACSPSVKLLSHEPLCLTRPDKANFHLPLRGLWAKPGDSTGLLLGEGTWGRCRGPSPPSTFPPHAASLTLTSLHLISQDTLFLLPPQATRLRLIYEAPSGSFTFGPSSLRPPTQRSSDPSCTLPGLSPCGLRGLVRTTCM